MMEREMKSQNEMQLKMIREMSAEIDDLKSKDKQHEGINYHNYNKLIISINYIVDTKKLHSVTKNELKEEQKEVEKLKLSLKESKGMTNNTVMYFTYTSTYIRNTP